MFAIYVRIVEGGAMSTSSVQVLESAIAGIPEIARRIVFLPTESRASAFDAAEQIYLQTAKELGGAEDLALRWTSAVMFRLREEVEEQLSTNRKLLKILHEELVGNPVDAILESGSEAPDDAWSGTVEKGIEQLVQNIYGQRSQENTLSNGAL